MQAHVVDDILQQRNISRSQPFQNVSSAKRHPQPQALSPWTSQEVPPGQPLRVHRVVQVEIPNIANMLDIVENKRDNPPREIEQVNPPVANETGQRQVPRECFPREAADNDLFVGRRHGAPGLSHGSDRTKRKTCKPGSQYANAVLDLRFVPKRQDLEKHLIRLSLHARGSDAFESTGS